MIANDRPGWSMFGNISIWQLIIVLIIVLLLFGTKRLKNLGSDLGSAIKGFKKAVDDKDADFENKPKVEDQSGETMQTRNSVKTEQKES